MTTGVIKASTQAAMTTSGRTTVRNRRAYEYAATEESPLPYHSAISDWARRIPSAPEMMKAGISKMPCGRRAAATKSGVWSLWTISMIAPITIPFKLMMKMVRIPNVAPPKKSRTHAWRLLAKSLTHISYGFVPSIWPATSFSKSFMSSSPMAGFCADATQPMVIVAKKRRSMTMIAFVSGELDIQYHPDHVPDPRCKPDNDHREQDEVPERGV